MRQHQDLRTFSVLLLTQALSLLGSAITGVAIGIWVFQRTGQATPFLLIALLTVLPRTLLGGFAGAVTDRWDRRWILLLADTGQALGTLVLGVSKFSNLFELWHLYFIAVVQASCAVVQEPAFKASITLLVPDQQRARANALQQVTSPATGILAPALAGWLYVTVGLLGIVVLDLATFAIALGALALVQIPRPMPTRDTRVRTSIWHDMYDGFRFVWGRRDLFWVLILLGVVNPVFLSAYRLYTPYILQRTGEPAVLGTILAVMNIGGVAGGLLLSIWGGPGQRLATMLGAIGVSALLLICVGSSQTAVALGLSLFGIMLVPPFIHVPLTTLIQRSVPADYQGRTFALLGVIAQGLTPLAYAVVGPVVDQILEPAVSGPSWAYVAPLVGTGAGAGMGLLMVMGGGLVILVTLVVAVVPALRALDGPSSRSEADDRPG